MSIYEMYEKCGFYIILWFMNLNNFNKKAILNDNHRIIISVTVKYQTNTELWKKPIKIKSNCMFFEFWLYILCID